MNRCEIKNRIAFKIWTAVTRVEKYNTCVAIQILVSICFISFRDDSFTRGPSNLRRFIYERSVTNIRDWSLAYSFIYSRSFNLRCRIISCHKSSFFYYLPPTLQLPTITAAFHNFFLLQPLHILSYLSSTHQQATWQNLSRNSVKVIRYRIQRWNS